MTYDQTLYYRPRIVRNPRALGLGAALLAGFVGLLALILSPAFGQGQNGLQRADALFSALSKGSAYFVDEVAAEADRQTGTPIDVELRARSADEAARWARLYDGAGAQVQVSGASVTVRGDLGATMRGAVRDSDAAYHGDTASFAQRYGIEPRAALWAWNESLKQVDAALLRAERFSQSRAVRDLLYRAVEPAYNYDGIGAQRVQENAPLTAFMLLFYLGYTLWYGAAVYFLCEGLGLIASKPTRKAEV
jgi:hypothetical protein